MIENFKLQHDSAIPLHHQVEDILRKMINAAEYQDGKLLPNEIDIAKRLGISRNTVRQATNKLVFEKLLIRKKGVGTRVARNIIATKLNRWPSFTQEMIEKGVTVVNYVTEISWEEATKEIAQLFGIKKGTKVLRLKRVRGLQSGPVVYFISYMHPRAGLTGGEDFSKPLYEMLEKEHNIIAAVSKENISAIVADEELAGILKIKEGDPILYRTRLVCDPGDRPIEYNLGYYRADQFTYTIDLARE